ncbi:hypothetical protein PLESTB_001087800 [Pleodorina starrii]|uniref:Uncharacterized protein n=1 Tax=Pleodorina starrii TaxID=330485 RepID=A0A9W6F5D0_9CHLO|nr:hypothetical protein PLESTM_000698500 [Pleodorina starrii]GLC56281.1 hypothetical protein PLESTB_001087800 [Pleodorina starrii]GLC69625.1 hypothetical protein PLESTF_000856200 [Pleodorina starrii]
MAERGRRNAGYWAPFNQWWRAHLEKHGERPKAEDLKRWFRDESKNAFPHEPPTYTMIRNHAKGLRDIASVKHYFRDYRARKRRAVADLAGGPSPKSEPEEEEDNSGGAGSPSDDACTSDEDWQGGSQKRRQNRERRRKRSQPDSKQQQGPGPAGAGLQHSQQPPCGAAATRQDADSVALEDQGDLTVTVTVTHSKRGAGRCSGGPRLETPLSSAASPGGSRSSPPQQQPHSQHQHPPSTGPLLPQQQQQENQPRQPQAQHEQGCGLATAQLSGAAHAAAHVPVSQGPQNASQAQLWGSGWRSAHTQLTVQQAGSGSGGEPAAAGRFGCALLPAGGGTDSNQAQQQQQHRQQQHLQQQPPNQQQYNPGGQLPGSATHHDAHAAYSALFRPGERTSAAAAAAGGAQQQQQRPGELQSFPPLRGSTAAGAAAAHAAGVPPVAHLSPISSQPVLSADAASTASTEVHRDAARPAADPSATGGLALEAGCSGGAGGGHAAAAAAGPAAAADVPRAMMKSEELYVGLHGSDGLVDRDGGGGPYGMSLRPPSVSAGGSLAQPWTPFAIPMTTPTEPVGGEARQQASMAGIMGPAFPGDGGGGGGGGGGQELQPPLSPFALRHHLDERGSAMAMSLDGAAGGGGGQGLLRSAPGSAPVAGDVSAGLQRRASWLQRNQTYLTGPGGWHGGGRGTDGMEQGGGGGGGHLHGGSAGPSPLSVASGSGLVPGRQMSLPGSLLPGADPRVAPGGGGFQQCAGANDVAILHQPQHQPQQQQQQLSAGPPPVTTGFAPCKGAARGAAISSCASVSGGTAGAAALQAGSPGSGQPLAGHVVLTGAGSGSAHPTTSLDAPSPGGAVAAATPSAAAAPTAAAMVMPETAAGSAHATARSVPAPTPGPRVGAGYPGGGGSWPGEMSPGPSSGAWSPHPHRAQVPSPGMPFPGPFPQASPATAAVAAAASPLPQANSVGLPPGMSSSSPSGRVRWLPYPPVLLQRSGPPPSWYPYSYPAVPPGHPVPSPRAPGFPAQYMAYGRPLVRRRYMSAPSNAPPLPTLPHQLQQLPPVAHLAQQQQQQQQLPQQQLHQPLPQYLPHNHHHNQQQQQDSPMLDAAWPGGGRHGSAAHGGRAPSFTSMSADPWVIAAGCYEDARSLMLTSTGSAPVPHLGGGYRPLPDGSGIGEMYMAGASGGGYGLRPPPAEMGAWAPPPGAAALEPGGADGIFDGLWGICMADDDAMPSVYGGGGELGGGAGMGPDTGGAGAAAGLDMRGMQGGMALMGAGGGGGGYVPADEHNTGAAYRGQF